MTWIRRWAGAGAVVAVAWLTIPNPGPSDAPAPPEIAAAAEVGIAGALRAGSAAVRLEEGTADGIGGTAFDRGDEEAPAGAEEAPPEAVLEAATGEATFYADYFEGRTTASGVPFRQNQMLAAHRTYPFGTLLRVTNLRNDRSVDVRVVDRGPFGARAKARGTIIDVSRRAAEDLGFIRAGRTPVRVEVLAWGGRSGRNG